MMHPDTDHPGDDLLFDFVEGTLPRARRSEVEQHVAGCARCSDLVAAAEAGRVDPAAAIEALPFAAEAQLHAALDHEWELRAGARERSSSRMPGWRRRLNLGLALGMVAVVLGVAVAQVGPGEEAATSNSDATQQDMPAAPEAASAPATAEGMSGGAEADSSAAGSDVARDDTTVTESAAPSATSGKAGETFAPPADGDAELRTRQDKSLVDAGAAQPERKMQLTYDDVACLPVFGPDAAGPTAVTFGPITHLAVDCRAAGDDLPFPPAE